KKITAYQNPQITIEVDGQTVDLSSPDGMVYPIIYEGRSYVPAKYVAEALGATINWNNARQVVEITSGEGIDPSLGIPSKDTSTPAQESNNGNGSNAGSGSSAGTGAASSNKGSFADPIK